jgi:multicomponent Na+:H+ antiporter subunit E
MPKNKVIELQERVFNLLLVNLLIAVVLPNFFTFYGGLRDSLLAFLLGLAALTLADRRYGIYLGRSALYFAYLGWEIILSNLAIAWLVLQPKPKLDPGIIAIPLSVHTDLEIMTLASSITLTPGTISVELGRTAQGRPALFVHALVVGDPGKMRAGIKDGFERRIIGISAGGLAP